MIDEFDGREVRCRICGDKVEAHVVELEKHAQSHRAQEVDTAAFEEIGVSFDGDHNRVSLSLRAEEKLENGEPLQLLIERRDERCVDILDIRWRRMGTMGDETVEEAYPHLFEEDE